MKNCPKIGRPSKKHKHYHQGPFQLYAVQRTENCTSEGKVAY